MLGQSIHYLALSAIYSTFSTPLASLQCKTVALASWDIWGHIISYHFIAQLHFNGDSQGTQKQIQRMVRSNQPPWPCSQRGTKWEAHKWCTPEMVGFPINMVIFGALWGTIFLRTILKLAQGRKACWGLPLRWPNVMVKVLVFHVRCVEIFVTKILNRNRLQTHLKWPLNPCFLNKTLFSQRLTYKCLLLTK